ncbi:colicin V family bacteriocin [Kalamiella sp. sgz302252]|uniref:colicin V family bacteriocin n=1 Tax=Pantoea sp. sgz302252 TaxID=3341827 RepID=UPI0036D23FB3
MKILSEAEYACVSGAGDINWVQVGRDVAVSGAVIAGTAFGTGLAGPAGPAIGVLAGAAVGALYDYAGYGSGSARWGGGLSPWDEKGMTEQEYDYLK